MSCGWLEVAYSLAGWQCSANYSSSGWYITASKLFKWLRQVVLSLASCHSDNILTCYSAFVCHRSSGWATPGCIRKRWMATASYKNLKHLLYHLGDLRVGAHMYVTEWICRKSYERVKIAHYVIHKTSTASDICHSDEVSHTDRIG